METKEEHNKNLERFLDVVEKYSLSLKSKLKKSKCIFSATCIDFWDTKLRMEHSNQSQNKLIQY